VIQVATGVPSSNATTSQRRFLAAPPPATKHVAPHMPTHRSSAATEADLSTTSPDLERTVLSEYPTPLPSRWRDWLELSTDSPVLGSGAFAEVFQVRHRTTSQCFAVKVMSRPNFAMRGIEHQLEAEIRAMRLASTVQQDPSNANVVQLYDVAEEDDNVFMLLELCPCGDVLSQLRQQSLGHFEEGIVSEWARQLLQGLRTLHAIGILHRDIKPDNLLCTAEGRLKIADFGWCAELADQPTTLAGTFHYMAPEVLQTTLQTEKADVWSTGVALYHLLVGLPLFTTFIGPGATQLSERDPHEATALRRKWLLEEISATCPPALDRRPRNLSLLCWDFLRGLLVPEVFQRASVDEALRHPWLAESGWSKDISVLESSERANASTSMGSSQSSRPSQPSSPARKHCSGEASGLMAESPALSAPSLQAEMLSNSPIAGNEESGLSMASPVRDHSCSPSRSNAYSPPLKRGSSDLLCQRSAGSPETPPTPPLPVLEEAWPERPALEPTMMRLPFSGHAPCGLRGGADVLGPWRDVQKSLRKVTEEKAKLERILDELEASSMPWERATRSTPRFSSSHLDSGTGGTASPRVFVDCSPPALPLRQPSRGMDVLGTTLREVPRRQLSQATAPHRHLNASTDCSENVSPNIMVTKAQRGRQTSPLKAAACKPRLKDFTTGAPPVKAWPPSCWADTLAPSLSGSSLLGSGPGHCQMPSAPSSFPRSVSPQAQQLSRAAAGAPSSPQLGRVVLQRRVSMVVSSTAQASCGMAQPIIVNARGGCRRRASTGSTVSWLQTSGWA